MTDQVKKGTGSSPEPSESDIAMEQVIEMQEALQLAYENESEAKKNNWNQKDLKLRTSGRRPWRNWGIQGNEKEMMLGNQSYQRKAGELALMQ